MNIGADKYLIKPISPRELTARVNAIFRRLSKDDRAFDSSSSLLFDDGRLSIDYDKRIVKVNNEELSVTRNEKNEAYSITGDRDKLKQVFINLLSYALKFVWKKY